MTNFRRQQPEPLVTHAPYSWRSMRHMPLSPGSILCTVNIYFSKFREQIFFCLRGGGFLPKEETKRKEGSRMNTTLFTTIDFWATAAIITCPSSTFILDSPTCSYNIGQPWWLIWWCDWNIHSRRVWNFGKMPFSFWGYCTYPCQLHGGMGVLEATQANCLYLIFSLHNTTAPSSWWLG